MDEESSVRVQLTSRLGCLVKKSLWGPAHEPAATGTTLALTLYSRTKVIRMQEGQDRDGDQSPEFMGAWSPIPAGDQPDQPSDSTPPGADPPGQDSWVVSADPGQQDAGSGQPGQPGQQQP